MAKHRYLFEFAATPGNPATAGSQAGWTESWYDPIDRTEADAATRAVSYKNRRLRLLTPGWSMTDIRISKLDDSNNLTRKGQLIHLPPQGNQGGYILQQLNYDEQPWDAVNIGVTTVGGSRRAFLIRGIGNDVVGAGGSFLNPARWANAFPVWVVEMAVAQAGFMGPAQQLALRTRTASATVLIKNVLTAPVANVNLAIDPTHPAVLVKVASIQAGNTISITGIEDMVGINGQWMAIQTQVDPTNNQQNYILLAPRRRVTVSGVYKQGGVARYWNWMLDPIIGATVGRGASRRTGRPPQQLRGRRSNRR